MHYLIIHSTKGRGKTLVENDFGSFEDAWDARLRALANPVWRDDDDIEVHVISGPSREVLAKTHSQYFAARRPRQAVSVP